MRALVGISLIVGALGCQAAPARSQEAAGSAVPPVPPAPATPAPPTPPTPDDDAVASPLGEDNARSVANLMAGPDAANGKRVHRATAVLLFSPRLEPDPDPTVPPTARVFQPLVCAIDGKRLTGARCGEVMPARATIRTSRGELAVTRSTRPFHDEAGEHDFPAPYGPACCMYNTCVGRTVPYRAKLGAPLAADPHTMLAVWPPDADVALEVVTPAIAADITPPLAPNQRVETSFHRGARSYAALGGRRSGGQLAWQLDGTWILPRPALGPRGYTLLATTDVDHDGHLELIAYQRWANDYGLDVYGDADQPLYSFSCGNI